mmetsp:Transcript_48767/g.117995  ORF Transcript_48767/g.117995 Transcript_48767/m.117995 type:complete len:514 (-) Transcript_48767:137-1678(-)
MRSDVPRQEYMDRRSRTRTSNYQVLQYRIFVEQILLSPELIVTQLLVTHTHVQSLLALHLHPAACCLLLWMLVGCTQSADDRTITVACLSSFRSNRSSSCKIATATTNGAGSRKSMQSLPLVLLIVISLMDFFCPAAADAAEIEDATQTDSSTVFPARRTESTIRTTIASTTSHRDDIQNLVLTVKEWLEHYVVLEPIQIKDVTISGYDKTGSRFHLSSSSLGLVEGRLTAPISNDAPFSDQLTLTGLTSVKGYTKFVHTILDGCSSHPIVGGGCWKDNDIISAFQEMASKPLQHGATAAAAFPSSSAAATTTTTNTATGGGSGAGFQIFCYNTAVLSTGGGGGGGVHPDSSPNGSGSSNRGHNNRNNNRDNYDGHNNKERRKVAGIGVGIQIQLGPATRTSFGGGLDYPATTKISLDRDAADCRTFCHALDNLVPILQQCYRDGHLRVEGGGGGGGGVTLIADESNDEERINNTYDHNNGNSDNEHDNNDDNNDQNVFSSGFRFQFKIFDNN